MNQNPIPEYHYLPLFDSLLLLKTANAATATLKTANTISIGTIPPVMYPVFALCAGAVRPLSVACFQPIINGEALVMCILSPSAVFSGSKTPSYPKQLR